jgi:hypothetical protein
VHCKSAFATFCGKCSVKEGKMPGTHHPWCTQTKMAKVRSQNGDLNRPVWICFCTGLLDLCDSIVSYRIGTFRLILRLWVDADIGWSSAAAPALRFWCDADSWWPSAAAPALPDQTSLISIINKMHDLYFSTRFSMNKRLHAT